MVPGAANQRRGYFIKCAPMLIHTLTLSAVNVVVVVYEIYLPDLTPGTG